MRASIKWLNDYVKIVETPESIAEKLTMAGVPVESILRLGDNIENIVTGKIVAISQHPDADKLSVCKLDVGTEKLTIVTGASNVRENQIVPVALIGAKLPNGTCIKETSLRGVLSQGMLCSSDELGIDSKVMPPELREGILILPEITPVGQDIKSAIGLDDVVLEFELTANRADCFSMLGLAREVSALTGSELNKPMLTIRERGVEKAQTLITVFNEEPGLCPRFTGRVLQNVKIGSSPEWLKQRLQAAGMRPINNVVDVTNYVMLEFGQPMHAYDYNLLARHEVKVRRAQEGERLTTLDGVKRELTSDMLVIADAVQPVGIAGVMGGLATEVTANTKTVFLEAAAFNGVSIRRTSRTLGLRSEASGRFERGVDVVNIVRALDRAAKLLEDMGVCQVCPGIIDTYGGVSLPVQIKLEPDKVNEFLGSDIPVSTMVNILKSLEFEIEGTHDIVVTVPYWRGDVTCHADICEEVARIYGYNNILSTLPQGRMEQGGHSRNQTIIDILRQVLVSAGLNETISFSFSHPSVYDKLNVGSDDNRRKAIPILNPITEDFPILRTTLLGNILDTVVRNITRKNDNIKIFEIGAVYLPDKLPLDELPEEKLMLCGAVVGKRYDSGWNVINDSVDFYDAKGLIEIVLEQLGIYDYQVTVGTNDSLHPGKTAIFTLDGHALAVIGEVHPQVAENFGLNRPVYIFEMYIHEVSAKANLDKYFSQLPKYPSITRDLALVLSSDVPAAAVNQAIVESAGSLLSDIILFDVYSGEQVSNGMKSLAYSLTFRDINRTLTDSEVEEYVQKIIVHLKETLSAQIRS